MFFSVPEEFSLRGAYGFTFFIIRTVMTNGKQSAMKSLRSAKCRLSFEALEDRKMLSAVGFVYGPPTYETWLQQEVGAVYSDL